MKHLLTLLLISASACINCLAQTTSPSVIISSGTLTKGEDASLKLDHWRKPD